MSKARDFGVQSYCFRNFKDNAEVARLVREIGLNKIEVCGVHADFSNPEGFRDVVDIYRQAGVEIVSLGVVAFQGEDSEENWFKCAEIAGCTHISAHFRVDSYMKAISKVRRWSRQYGVRVGIHCHGGYMFGGSPDVINHLIALGGLEIGVCIDTAWCLQIGPRHGKPVEWAEQYAGQIYGIHFKDFTFGSDGKWSDVVVGEGNLDLPAFVAALEKGNFDGMAVIEYEADPENPVPALKKCVEKMRSLVG